MRIRAVRETPAASGSIASSVRAIAIGLGLIGIGWYAGAAVAQSRAQRIRQQEQAGPMHPLDNLQAGSLADDDEDDLLNQPTPHTM